MKWMIALLLIVYLCIGVRTYAQNVIVIDKNDIEVSTVQNQIISIPSLNTECLIMTNMAMTVCNQYQNAMGVINAAFPYNGT